ncbi:MULTISPECIES: hypothetical protein [unclassified Leclercia]|uniref:Uncharacterized protein n=1 Tax=Leclercia barmai TaxID=2785629 RepID=A0ABS7S1U2_9ENTR|nr:MULTISPECIES: hypothetical protein [unclassified Leclercia]MBZ0059283.1 hypothetical protein [Leclercia sp. EMC7]MCM5697468.1 hypothetical protein [Leclercia sp. LTM01]MCM5701907.1 hypothetical protein [Leclercia sp. LTM14]
MKGKTDLPTVLRKLADYWEQDYSEQPIHPSFVLDQSKRFGKFTRKRMIKELRAAGVEVG